MKPPAVPLVANVLARAVTDPAEIVQRLVEQVTGTVRWREWSPSWRARALRSFYEVGAGKVLSGLVKRIADGATGTAIGTPDDVAAFKAARGHEGRRAGARCARGSRSGSAVPKAVRSEICVVTRRRYAVISHALAEAADAGCVCWPRLWKYGNRTPAWAGQLGIWGPSD